jgi:hypothetical protein
VVCVTWQGHDKYSKQWSKKLAAIKVQAINRGKAARRELMRRHFFATTIQSAARRCARQLP